MTSNPRARMLIQVVPPGSGGVRDHATCLQAEWQRAGLPTRVLELSKSGAAERSLTRLIDDACTEPRRPCTLLVHYSGYGYGQRGICFWLLRELQAARVRFGAALRIVVLFHETYANGPPWRSAFWVSPAQALIAVRLARLADALATNTEHHAGWLRRAVRAEVGVLVRPVFSNVGESDGQPAPMQRAPRAVVFGLASTRQRAVDALRDHEAGLRRLGIDELIEVGGGTTTRRAASTMPVRSLGRLEAPALGELLRASRFGLLAHPSHSLGKSGVFAAYAAHGCVAINTGAAGADADGLVAGRDYLDLLALDAAARRAAALDGIAESLLRWYAGHAVARQAQDFLALAMGGSAGIRPLDPTLEPRTG